MGDSLRQQISASRYYYNIVNVNIIISSSPRWASLNPLNASCSKSLLFEGFSAIGLLV